jgi:hypothetical protein
MKSIMQALLALSPLTGTVCADTEPTTLPAQKTEERSAKKAFEEVKKNLKDGKFTDSVAMLMAMKEGFSDMTELLRICDTNLVSDDEISRSAAFLCGEAINALRQSGQLIKWADEKQVDAVDAYDWKNGAELNRLAEEPGYQTKRMPSYEAFMARAAAQKKR